MTLTKSDIISTVSNHLGLSKVKSAQMAESLLKIIKQTLANGEDVLISGFGKFCVRLIFYSCRVATARKPSSIKDRDLEMFKM
jgi:nucleoid DNA-binding protein